MSCLLRNASGPLTGGYALCYLAEMYWWLGCRRPSRFASPPAWYGEDSISRAGCSGVHLRFTGDKARGRPASAACAHGVVGGLNALPGRVASCAHDRRSQHHGCGEARGTHPACTLSSSTPPSPNVSSSADRGLWYSVGSAAQRPRGTVRVRAQKAHNPKNCYRWSAAAINKCCPKHTQCKSATSLVPSVGRAVVGNAGSCPCVCVC